MKQSTLVKILLLDYPFNSQCNVQCFARGQMKFLVYSEEVMVSCMRGLELKYTSAIKVENINETSAQGALFNIYGLLKSCHAEITGPSSLGPRTNFIPNAVQRNREEKPNGRIEISTAKIGRVHLFGNQTSSLKNVKANEVTAFQTGSNEGTSPISQGQSNPGVLTFECHYCAAVFAQENSRMNHERKHVKLKPFACKFCNGTFSFSHELYNHETNSHPQKEQFKCDLCYARFSIKQKLEIHKKRVHQISPSKAVPGKSDCCKTVPKEPKASNGTIFFEKLLQCLFCGEKFSEDHALFEHIRTHAVGSFIAPENTDNTSQHKSEPNNTITGTAFKDKKPVFCTFCRQTLTDEITLKPKNGGNVIAEFPVCRFCHGKFLSKKPAIILHRVNIEDAITCDKCNAVFFEKTDLDGHQEIHSTEQWFACRCCDASFAHLFDMIDHERYHRKQKFFACSCCPARLC